jgi:hypothetical protein
MILIINYKGEVVYVLKHYAMKTYRGVVVHIHVFLTLALFGGRGERREGVWSVSSPQGKRPQFPMDRRCWVGPTTSLDAKKRKFLTLQ